MGWEKVHLPVVERAVLERLRHLRLPGGTDVLSKVVTTYLESSRRMLDELRGLEVTGQIEDHFWRMAHTLKSGSANVGAIRLAHLCTELEKELEHNRIEQAIQLIRCIYIEYELVAGRLLREIRRP